MAPRSNFPTLVGTLALAAVFALGNLANAAAIWDGNGDADNDGNWGSGTNWDDGSVPSAATATLGDVDGNGDSGDSTRTVTIGGNQPNITQLTMNQSTAGFTNRLNMTGGTLTISNSTMIDQTLTGGSIQIDMGGSAYLRADGGNSWTNDGTLNLAGSNVRIGPESGAVSNTSVTNLGTVNATGSLAVIGNLQGRNATADTGSVTVNNNSGGTISVADNATLRLRSHTRFRGNAARDGNLINSSGSTVQIGSVPGGASGGTLQFYHFNGGDLKEAGESSVSVQRFQNAGTLELLGDSTLELVEDRSGGSGVYGVARVFTVENQSTGVINLNGSSQMGRVGAGSGSDQNIVTVFSNAGTLNKTGTGQASVVSFGGSVTHSDGTSTSGSNTNTGTINVQESGGILQFSVGLLSTGNLIGNGTVTADSGAIEIGADGIVHPGQTAGDFASFSLDASLGDGVVFADGSTLTIDLGLVDGVNDTLNISGDLDLTGNNTLMLNQSSFEPGEFTILNWTGTRTDMFSTVLYNGGPLPTGDLAVDVEYLAGNSILVTVSIPEPASACVLLVGGMALVRRRRA
jgi:hypothetical protein